MNVRDTIRAAIAHTKRHFAERDLLVDHMYAAMLGQHHVFIIGPPGTAKTMLCEHVAAALGDGTFYGKGFNATTPPEEVYGVLKLSAMQRDVYERKIEGYLPTANIAFLDELGRASGVLRDSMLGVLNERKYRNGDTDHRCPLICAFAGSNSLVTDEAAFADRFLVFVEVAYIRDPSEFKRLLGASKPPPPPQFTLAALARAQREVNEVRVDNAFRDLVYVAREKLAGLGIIASDRRWISIVEAVKPFAWLDGRDALAPEDIEWAADMLWKRPPERRVIIRELGNLANPLAARAVDLLDQAQREYDGIPPVDDASFDIKKCAAANHRLRAIVQEMDTMIRANSPTRTAKVREAKGATEVMLSNLVARARKATGT